MAVTRQQLQEQNPDASSLWIANQLRIQNAVSGLTPEQLTQYQTAPRRSRFQEAGARDQASLLEEFDWENKQAAAQQEVDTYYQSIRPTIDAFKANPKDPKAYWNLWNTLAAAPINRPDPVGGTSDVMRKGLQRGLPELQAIHDIGTADPQLGMLMGEAQRLHDPGAQKTPWHMKLATALPFAALAASSPLTTALSGSSATAGAPFSAMLGGETIAGTSIAPFTTAASIPNIGLADQITNAFQTPPTGTPTTTAGGTTAAGTTATTAGSSVLDKLTDPATLAKLGGGVIGGLAGASQNITAPNIPDPTRVARSPIEQQILAVTEPRLQRLLDLQTQERAAKAGATGGTTSGEILRDQLQRQLGTESMAKNALDALQESYRLQESQQRMENAFADAITGARTGQVTGQKVTQDANLANLFGGIKSGVDVGTGLFDIFKAA